MYGKVWVYGRPLLHMPNLTLLAKLQAMSLCLSHHPPPHTHTSATYLIQTTFREVVLSLRSCNLVPTVPFPYTLTTAVTFRKCEIWKETAVVYPKLLTLYSRGYNKEININTQLLYLDSNSVHPERKSEVASCSVIFSRNE